MTWINRADAHRSDEQGFWRKCRQLVGRGSVELLEKALCLFYAAQRPETPAWARATAWTALVYLILPADAIPDWIPVTGYSDDLSALAYALYTISQFVDEDVRRRASVQVVRWFPGMAARPAEKSIDS